IAIAPPEDEEPLRQAAREVASYDWVLFTSVNAARALLDRLPPDARPRAVACVGEATAHTVEAYGMAVDLVPPEFNAKGLLHALTARLGDDLTHHRFLMPRAAEGRETLPDGLRARG